MPAGGAQITVTAPVAGTLGADSRLPAVGSHVEKGQIVLTLVPLAPAERDVRIEAERAVAEAAGRQEMAAKRAERARQLARDGSGSRRAAEEAQADLAVADAALKAARDRLALAARRVSASGAIAARRAACRAAPHPACDAGADRQRRRAAVRSRALETVWLRVPLYAGDVDTIDRRAPARSRAARRGVERAGRGRSPGHRPAVGRCDDRRRRSLLRIANRDRTLQPGQRVTVRLPLRAREESLVVPRAALLYDAFGGTWVYEARDGGTFVRRRVALADLVGDTAVLRQGPPAGTRVVTAGAAELSAPSSVSGSSRASRMMRALIAASLRLRLPVVALSVILMVVGISAANDAPFDVFPEFAPPLVEIQTEAPGLSSADVEALISVPLEAAMNGVPGLDVLRSKSVLGLSSVVLIFENGTDRIRRASARPGAARARGADAAGSGPSAGHPVAALVAQPRDEDRHVIVVALAAGPDDPGAVDDPATADGVPGVANVAIWGQRDRQLQVLVDPDRLRANGVTLQDVVTSTRDAMSVTAGGFLEGPTSAWP